MYEQYTDKQIVEMLMPKLAKSGWDSVDSNDLYPDTIEMIATIYRLTYIRGQLGRSFIIGEPKQTEHWVPATKDNIEIGSKVRYINNKKRPRFFSSKNKNIIGKIMSFCGDEVCDIQWFGDPVTGIFQWLTAWEDLEVLLCE